jgi:type I restriction enzyme R subunit
MNILFQITFIQKIIGYLNINGILEKTMLTQPPFNDLDDNGVIGIFPDEGKFYEFFKLYAFSFKKNF